MRFVLAYVIVAIVVGISGCVGGTNDNGNLTIETSENSTELQVEGIETQINSGNLTYPVYVAAPTTGNKKPGIVLIHSFRGLEPGYIDLVDKMASENYVIIAPKWQTFETSPSDEVIEELINDSIIYLKARPDVDPNLLGLTGFCAGGRYTMLFMPQIEELDSGVAWYGFPYSGGSATQPDKPVDALAGLEDPLLIIHGTRDQASNISDIYSYAVELDNAEKYFEMKVYQGQPHGFMIENGQLSQSFEAQDAYWQMMTFFDRTLK